MATVYVERECTYPNAEYIPYQALAPLLFSRQQQKVIPFLGAGASLQSIPAAPTAAFAPLEPEKQEKVNKACESLGFGLTSPASRFIEASIRLAWEMDKNQHPSAGRPTERAFERVAINEGSPSSSELAEVFAERSDYDWFEQPAKKLQKLFPTLEQSLLKEVCRSAARITGITSAAPPLLTAASYYSHKNIGDPAWKVLRDLLSNKNVITETHKLVAEAAWYHFRASNSKQCFLIITTNYDCLMERALDLVSVPYWVITVTKSDRKVRTRFSDSVKEYMGLDDEGFMDLQQRALTEKVARSYFLMPEKPLVLVYKIHGCIKPNVLDETGEAIILSDEDYIDYLRHDGPSHEMVPALLDGFMDRRAFWFLGYNFADWNVRGIYKSIVEDELRPKSRSTDCAVIRSLDPYEASFFKERQNVKVLETELSIFADRILENVPEAVSVALKDCPLLKSTVKPVGAE